MIYLLTLLFMTLFCVLAMVRSNPYKQTAFRQKEVVSEREVTPKKEVSLSNPVELSFADKLALKKTEEMKVQYNSKYSTSELSEEDDYQDEERVDIVEEDDEVLLEEIMVNLGATQ